MQINEASWAAVAVSLIGLLSWWLRRQSRRGVGNDSGTNLATAYMGELRSIREEREKEAIRLMERVKELEEVVEEIRKEYMECESRRIMLTQQVVHQERLIDALQREVAQIKRQLADGMTDTKGE